MKIYTLMETDTDTAGPSVGVFSSAQEAIAVGTYDITANGNRIIEEETEAELESWFKGTGKKLVWAVRHLDVDGNEFITEVQEHDFINPEEGS